MSGNIYHSWNGTVLTITSDSGTSSADLRGSTGIRGAQGIPGIITDTTGKINLAGLATQEELAAKQNQLIAGNNIEINNDVISAIGDVKEEDFKELKRSLDYLWKFNQGISYQFENRDYNTYFINAPTGAKIAAINKIGGMTRKCRNLIPFPYYETTKEQNGVTWTVNSDKSITASGMAEAYSDFKIMRDIKIPCKIFTVTIKSLGAFTNVYGAVIITDSSGNDVEHKYTDVNKSYTFNMESLNAETVRINLYRVTDNTECSGTFIVMLNEGDTALPYEPYFEGLRNTAVTEFESIGANLFNITNVHSKYTPNNQSFIIPAGSYYRDFFTYTAGGTADFALDYIDKLIQLDEGEYIFTWEDNSLSIRVCEVDKTTGTVSSLGNIKSGDILTLSKRTYITIRNVSNTEVTFTNFQIAKGTTALPYEPYRKSTLPIPEAVQAIEGYGWGVSDTVYNYVDWENGKFVRRVGKVVYNGTERWYLDRYNSHGAYVYNTALISTTLAISDKFTRSDGSWGEKGVGYFSPNGTHIYFNSDKATVEEWKAYLAENPVTVYYELAEPVITDISELLTVDNILDVEANGTITPVNEFEYDVPTNIEYLISLAEVGV